MTSPWLLAFVFLVMILICSLCIIYLICHAMTTYLRICIVLAVVPFSPYDVSDIAHEETPIVPSYMLGDFDQSHPLHDPNTCVHNMLPMNEHAIDVPYNCILNLCPIVLYTITIPSWWMTCSYTMHQISLSYAYLVLTLMCTYTSWWMMCTFTTRTISLVCVSFV